MSTMVNTQYVFRVDSRELHTIRAALLHAASLSSPKESGCFTSLVEMIDEIRVER